MKKITKEESIQREKSSYWIGVIVISVVVAFIVGSGFQNTSYSIATHNPEQSAWTPVALLSGILLVLAMIFVELRKSNYLKAYGLISGHHKKK